MQQYLALIYLFVVGCMAIGFSNLEMKYRILIGASLGLAVSLVWNTL